MREKDIDFKYSIFSILYKKDDNPCFIRDELDWRPMNGEARQALRLLSKRRRFRLLSLIRETLNHLGLMA